MKLRFILVAGKREMQKRAVNMPRLGLQDQKAMKLDEAIAAPVAEAMPPDMR